MSAYLSFDYYAQVNQMLFWYIQELSKARAAFSTTSNHTITKKSISLYLLVLSLFLLVHFSDAATTRITTTASSLTNTVTTSTATTVKYIFYSHYYCNYKHYYTKQWLVVK